MAALTRRESEERQAAVLRYFIDNPRATGDEAQRALTSGRLTGKKNSPPMGIGMLFRLKRQAEDMARKGVRPPEAPHPVAVPVPAPADDSTMDAVRDRVRELQRMMSGVGVMEIHITRDDARLVRLQPSEEKL